MVIYFLELEIVRSSDLNQGRSILKVLTAGK